MKFQIFIIEEIVWGVPPNFRWALINDLAPDRNRRRCLAQRCCINRV